MEAEERESALKIKLSPFVEGEIEADSMKDIFQTLSLRKDASIKLLEKLAEEEKAYGILSSRVESGKIESEKRKNELSLSDLNLDNLQKEREPLIGKRKELLGDLDTDSEWERARYETEKAQNLLKTSETIRSQKEKDMEVLLSRANELRRTIEEKQKSLSIREISFGEGLSKKGFIGEEDFIKARLSEEEREELRKKDEALGENKTRAESLLSQNIKTRAQEEEKNLSPLSAEELKSSVNAINQNLKEILEKKGSHAQRLFKNNEAKGEREKKEKALEERKKIFQRFERLNALIGSQNGDKFRKYAQGLNFDLLIGHANIQLKKMTERYSFIQDKETPLEFTVVDNFQGGVNRTTKNLSGGESFIVSLSLALGLSFMTSENVQVDSLFLDEGFGTLDEESLNTAITALSELPARNNEDEAKTIGIISHVAYLKERVAVAIEVTPRTGGRSVISGPGVRYLGD
jgi:exonuclease SbcC